MLGWFEKLLRAETLQYIILQPVAVEYGKIQTYQYFNYYLDGINQEFDRINGLAAVNS